ncbi:MAG: DUF4268 domain-containing protein [Bacteroidales bacterium]|nr:DUF4268 domain-containing protein [Bacteroidales bacterium]
MYSKEEAKETREKFWSQFKNWSGKMRNKAGKKGRWLMNDTGIRQIRLKFHFDEEIALVAIEVDTRNLDKRIDLWNKLESLNARLTEMADFEINWELEYLIGNGKSVSRIFSRLDHVSIYTTEDWKAVNKFFYSRMTVFEEFFLEYRDFLKY